MRIKEAVEQIALYCADHECDNCGLRRLCDFGYQDSPTRWAEYVEVRDDEE